MKQKMFKMFKKKPKTEEPKDLGLKIISREESVWMKVKKAREATLSGLPERRKQLDDEQMLEESVLALAIQKLKLIHENEALEKQQNES